MPTAPRSTCYKQEIGANIQAKLTRALYDLKDLFNKDTYLKRINLHVIYANNKFLFMNLFDFLHTEKKCMQKLLSFYYSFTVLLYL